MHVSRSGGGKDDDTAKEEDKEEEANDKNHNNNKDVKGVNGHNSANFEAITSKFCKGGGRWMTQKWGVDMNLSNFFWGGQNFFQKIGKNTRKYPILACFSPSFFFGKNVGVNFFLEKNGGSKNFWKKGGK